MESIDQMESSSMIDSDPSFLENEDILFNLKRVISSVSRHHDAWPFREKVNEKEAPNYYEIIKNPMDLSIISEKIENKTYENFQQLENDLKLIVNNSEVYNGQFNGFTTNSYSVWRNFRRLTKKYLNHELSLDDKDAFIFLPRKYNNGSKANVGKRKKSKKQKKSSKFQALELLYNATQDSIESTFQKFAFSPMSDSENKQLNENLPKKYQFDKCEKAPTGFYNEAFANLDNYSNLNGFYTEENRNENLLFKSLNEWNKLIDEDGLAVVLPEKGVYVNNSPVDKNWLTNFPDDQPNYKTVFNEEMFKAPINGQLHNGQLILSQPSLFSSKEPSRQRKCKKSNRNTKNNSKDGNQEISKDQKKSNDQKIKMNEENLIEMKSDLNEETTEKSIEKSIEESNVEKMSIDMKSIDIATSSKDVQDTIMKNSGEHVELKQNAKKRLVIKLSKLNNDWKPINCTEDSGSESDSSSDSSSCSSSCSCSD